METYETKDYIEEVMSNLNEQDAELMEMRYWYKMTYREIGKELGISHQRASQKLKDALKSIRLYIVKKLDRPPVKIVNSIYN